MQQDWPLEGFGKDPAAIATHFAQALQRPPIEGERHRNYLPSSILFGNPSGIGWKRS